MHFRYFVHIAQVFRLLRLVFQQSLRQREYLMKTYQPNDLFVVVSDYWSPNKTDLNCSRDELLGVIKRQDPSGNNKLWFCDNAGIFQKIAVIFFGLSSESFNIFFCA